MGAEGVVLMDPCIKFCLRTGLGIKYAAGEKLGAKTSMEALDLACRCGRAGSLSSFLCKWAWSWVSLGKG